MDEGEGHDDGRLLRDAEGTLRDAEDQGETEDDGDPVLLFRDPHGQRGRLVKSNSRTATGHALKVNRKYAHKRGLRKDRSWNKPVNTRNPGDKACTKRENVIKRRVGGVANKGWLPLDSN